MPHPGDSPAQRAKQHRACRPAWICTADAVPWPCPRAREALAEAYGNDPDRLTPHLATVMVQAASELRLADPVQLYQRFVGWALPRNRACRLCGKPRHDAIPWVPLRFLPCEVASLLSGYEEELSGRPG
jgi:hypothetical protein